jgi:Phosphotransferase enzyme family
MGGRTHESPGPERAADIHDFVGCVKSRAAETTGLRALLGARLGRPVERCGMSELLEVAADEGLPLRPVVDSLRMPVPSEWEAAIETERALQTAHRETARIVERAMGSLCGLTAWSDPAWRRGAAGWRLVMLVPGWALVEATSRLASAGLLHLSRFDLPGSATLVRTFGAEVSDVVMVEALRPGDDVEPPAEAQEQEAEGRGAPGAPTRHSSLGELTAATALRRVLERVDRIGGPRLLELADIEMSGWTLPPGRARLGVSATRGLVLVEQARDRLVTCAGAAAGPALGPTPGRASQASGSTVSSGHVGHLGVVAFRGSPPARDHLASRLAGSLRRVGVPTHLGRVAEDGLVVFVGGTDGGENDRSAEANRPVAGTSAPSLGGRFLSRTWRRTTPSPDVTVTALPPPGDGLPADHLHSVGQETSSLSDSGVPVVVASDADEAHQEVLHVVLRRLLVREETVGRHPALWRVLLPLDVEGAAVIANLGRVRTENLQHTYPHAVSLATEMADLEDASRGVVWDGSRAPLRPSSAGLVIVDDRDGRTLDAVLPAGRAGGASAALVPANRPFDYVVYPDADYPLLVTRQEWPTWAAGSSIRLRLARWRVRTPFWRLARRDALRVDAPGRSLAAMVLGDLADRSGSPASLRGVMVGRGRGQMTLRARLGATDMAVRLGLTPRGVERLRAHEAAERRLAGLEGRIGLAVPEVILAGEVGGVAWVAEEWLAGRSGPGGGPWSPRGGWGWAVTEQAAVSLGRELVTGHVGQGWAKRWASPLGAVAPEHLGEIVAVLEPVERSEMQTSWTHGDLWPGNVFLRGRHDPPLVIDWDRGRQDAPSGLDAVFLEIVRNSLEREVTIGSAAGSMVLSGAPGLSHVSVGGGPFGSWPMAVRRGLVVASFLRTASGGSVSRPTWSELWTEENLRPVLAACRTASAQTG